MLERHNAVGVETEVAFQNENGLDLAFEDVRLASDSGEELEIVREREVAILAVRKMAVGGTDTIAKQINPQLFYRVDAFRKVADGQRIDDQRTADERPTMTKKLEERIEKAKLDLRAFGMGDDRAADGLL